MISYLHSAPFNYHKYPVIVADEARLSGNDTLKFISDYTSTLFILGTRKCMMAQASRYTTAQPINTIW
jgi:hypothetical protein